MCSITRQYFTETLGYHNWCLFGFTVPRKMMVTFRNAMSHPNRFYRHVEHIVQNSSTLPGIQNDLQNDFNKEDCPNDVDTTCDAASKESKPSLTLLNFLHDISKLFVFKTPTI